MSTRVTDGADVNMLETSEGVETGIHIWQGGGVHTDTSREWLTIPDLAEVLGLGVSKVRRLLEDRALLAQKVDGVLKVPADFIRNGEPLPELRGTLIVLADSGFSDTESLNWLLDGDDTLGSAPIDALRSGRKAEVRRVAQALGF